MWALATPLTQSRQDVAPVSGWKRAPLQREQAKAPAPFLAYPALPARTHCSASAGFRAELLMPQLSAVHARHILCGALQIRLPVRCMTVKRAGDRIQL